MFLRAAVGRRNLSRSVPKEEAGSCKFRNMLSYSSFSQRFVFFHINVLELRASKFSTLTFTRMYLTIQFIHFQVDNTVALSCLIKIKREAVCAFHFVKILHFVEVRAAYCLNLQNG